MEKRRIRDIAKGTAGIQARAARHRNGTSVLFGTHFPGFSFHDGTNTCIYAA